MIYGTVLYFIVTVIFYTINQIAYTTMLQRITYSAQDRSVISSISSLLSTVMGTIFGMIVPIMLPMLGGEKLQSTWTTIVIVHGVVATLLHLGTALGVKEKNIESAHNQATNATQVQATTGNQLKMLLKERYFYLVAILITLYFTSANLSGINYYYARDVIGNLTFMSVSGLVSLVPNIVGIMFVPKLFAKFGKRNTMTFGLALSTVASLAIYINPHSMMMNLVMMVIRTLGTLPTIVATSTLAGDLCDFNQMKHGMRAEGITTSAFTIGTKIGSGLGTALVGWMLAFGNYNAAATVQAASATNAMTFTVAAVPAILYILFIVALRFWDLEKYQPQVQEFLNRQVK